MGNLGQNLVGKASQDHLEPPPPPCPSRPGGDAGERGPSGFSSRNLTIIIPKTQFRGHLLQEAFFTSLYSQSWPPLLPTTGQGLLCLQAVPDGAPPPPLAREPLVHLYDRAECTELVGQRPGGWRGEGNGVKHQCTHSALCREQRKRVLPVMTTGGSQVPALPRTPSPTAGNTEARSV